MIQHLWIIMDGNRRWAKKQGKMVLFWHKAGFDNAVKISELVAQKGIKYLTLWALSTENLHNREKEELNGIIGLIELLPTLLPIFERNGTKFETIGDIQKLPERTQKILEDIKEKTKDNISTTLIIALVYWGQDEIVRGIKKYIENGWDGKNLDTKEFRKYIDNAPFPPPDLIVRTGGNVRHSGFLLYDCDYSEYYFSEQFWPEFDEKELDTAIHFFESSKRNFGK
jgi:undecaprenyl diphosphate synthase